MCEADVSFLLTRIMVDSSLSSKGENNTQEAMKQRLDDVINEETAEGPVALTSPLTLARARARLFVSFL